MAAPASLGYIAQYSLQLLRGQMINEIITGQLSGRAGSFGMSLQEFILGKPQKPARSGSDIMDDALSGLMRSDSAMLRQASKNVQEGAEISKTASESLSAIQEKLGQMQGVVANLANPALDSSRKGALRQEYDSLAGQIQGLIKNTKYNGISLLDGQAWADDERVNQDQSGSSGKISLQAGKEATDLTLFDVGQYANFQSADTDENALTATSATLAALQSTLSGMRQSYEARQGLYASEAASYERQAGILEEATQRADPENSQSLKDALLEILTRDQGLVFNVRS